MGLDLGELELRVVGVHLLDLFSRGCSQNLQQTSGILKVVKVPTVHGTSPSRRVNTRPRTTVAAGTSLQNDQKYVHWMEDVASL